MEDPQTLVGPSMDLDLLSASSAEDLRIDRVEDAQIRDPGIVVGLTGLDRQTGDRNDLVDREHRLTVFGESIDGPLTRRAVDPDIGHLGEPDLELLI